MTKNVGTSSSQCLNMRFQVRKQQVERAALMRMRNDPPRDAPKPFNALGVRVIGRSLHHTRRLFAFGQQTAHEQGASRGLRLEIVSNPHGTVSSLWRTSDGMTRVLTEDISGAPCGNTAIKPPIAPVQQAKTIDVPMIGRCLDQAWPASSFPRPDACDGRVKGHRHLIVRRQMRVWQQSEQTSQIGGKLIAQVSLNQIRNGERFGDGRPGEQNLSPQAFPTESVFSSALRRSVQVDRVQT
jgi:hypothetical protein